MSSASGQVGESHAPTTGIGRVIFASSLGTLFEWYDFYLYGILATFFSVLFFPKGNDTAAFLASLATFGAGFAVRPFGALVFGRIGDLVGRKYTFLVTIVIMGLSTALIGLLPTYESVGILSPILLVSLRLAQGLALGGEYGGAATYVAEHAPDNKRGFYTSFIQTTASGGLVLALFVVYFCRSSFSADDFKVWGWRVPFLCSFVLLGASIYIRMKLHESPVFQKLKTSNKISKNPLKESFANPENLKFVLLSLFGATAAQGIIFYTSQFYALFFLTKTMTLPWNEAYWIVGGAVLLATPFFVVFGGLSDKIGRKPILVAGFALSAILYIPIFKGLQTYATPGQVNHTMLFLLVFVATMLVCLAYGPIAAFLVELFPTHIRYTSMSLPYHIGNGVFGGFMPLIAESVVAQTGNPLSGIYYPIAVCAISTVVAIAAIKEAKHHKLID